MRSIRHWEARHWVVAGIFMPLLLNALGWIRFFGLAITALIMRRVPKTAPTPDPETDLPR